MSERMLARGQVNPVYLVGAVLGATIIYLLLISGKVAAVFFMLAVAAAAGVLDPLVKYVYAHSWRASIPKYSEPDAVYLFASFSDVTTDAIVNIGLDGRIVFFNQGAEQMFGRAASTILGQSFAELLPPDSETHSRVHFQKLLEENPDQLLTFVQQMTSAVRHDDSVFPVATFAMHLAGQDDVTVLAVIRDVSERVQALENHIKREQQFRVLLENMPLMVAVLDIEGGVNFWNNECERVTGYSASEIIGNPAALKLLFPDDDYRNATMQEWLERDPGFTGWELDITCKDGKVRTISWSNVSDFFAIPGWLSWAIGMDVTERNRAQRALEEREQQYRTLVNDSPLAILVHSEGIIRFVNPALVSLFGAQTADDLIGRRTLDFAHPDFSPVVEERINRVYRQEGHSEATEGKFVGLNGQVVEVEIMGSMINFEGKPAAQSVFHDITKRKRAEAALRESQARLSEAQRIANIGHWEWDIERDKIFLSSELYRIFGIDAQTGELAMNTFIQYVYPDDRPMLMESIQAALDQDAPFMVEHRVVLVDDHIRVLHCEGELHRSADGKPQRLIVVAQDVTERKRVEEALWEEALRNEQILQTTLDGYILSDMDGSIVDVNPAYCAMIGYTRNELLGMSLWDIIIAPNREMYDMRLKTIIAEGAIRYTSRHRRKDGSMLELDVSITRMHRASEQPLLVIFLRDLTDLNQIQEQLFQSELRQMELEKEREVVELKERFISMVSHEFRTPLTVIVSSSDMIQNYYDRLTRESTLKHLSKVKSQALFMAGLLDDVLMFSKSRSGVLEFSPEWFDLDHFCGTLYEQILPLNTDDHVIQFEHENLKEVFLDRKLLQHILTNLVSNAFKYSPPGSTVRCKLTRENDEIVYCISDEGIGIPKADQERLFEPFHRASNVHEVAGTGLGLAIVKNCVDLHSGAITFESHEGRGTTFMVRLPVIQPPRAEE